MSVTDDCGLRSRGEEAGLVARIASGDVGAPVAELYRRYGKRLFRFGVKHLGNDGLAEEMVQETFVRLWRTARRFDAGKASVGTYLYVIARSVAADIHKRPSSRPFLPVMTPTSRPWPTASTRSLTPWSCERRSESQPEQAEVIRLGHEEGLTQSQIAERLRIPWARSRPGSFHGIRALRSALLERGFHGV